MIRTYLLRGVRLLAMACLMATVAVAQEPRVVRLGAPDAAYPGEWTNITRVHELKDGRLVVLDVGAQVVSLADPKTGRAARLGGKGSGPGEYLRPVALLPLHDSTIIVDDANPSSPIVVDGSGAVRGSLPAPSAQSIAFLKYVPIASDTAGRVYRRGGRTPGNVTAIERFDRAANRVDTAALVQGGNGCTDTPPRAADARGPGVFWAAARLGPPNPFPSAESRVVAGDGTVALICADPYRVVFASGADWFKGPSIPYERIRVTDADKEAWRERQRAPVPVEIRNGNSIQRGSSGVREVVEPDKWPETLPPFSFRALYEVQALFAPDGDLWIVRAVNADAPAMFDVVGRDGRLVKRVVGPLRARLVGFGAKSVFLAILDDDDVQHLHRFTRP